MRKILTAVCLGTLSGAAMLAAAATPDSRPETRAYFNLGFGGARELPSSFHYGLRLDQDRRFAPANAPAVMQFDVSGAGVVDARLNGLNLLRRDLSANQEEGAAVATTTWSAADWGLIVLGVAGVGYAGYEVAGSHQDSGTTSPSSSGGGTTAGGNTAGGGTTGGGTSGNPLGGLTGLTTGGLTDIAGAAGDERTSREYQEWLDGGTGHMGDLSPAR